MNDKEKQIEEMAKDIIRSASLDVQGRAEYYYEQGYRIIPKDSVVLSREELEKMVNAKMKCINDMAIIARKETAEKIYYKAEKKAHFKDGGCYDKDRYYLDMEDLKEILKQFGVEIKD